MSAPGRLTTQLQSRPASASPMPARPASVTNVDERFPSYSDGQALTQSKGTPTAPRFGQAATASGGIRASATAPLQETIQILALEPEAAAVAEDQ